MKKAVLLPFLLLTCFSLIFAQRGTIVSFDWDQSFTKQEIRDLFDNAGIPSTFLTIDYSVDIYKVKYETVNVDAVTPVNATGIVAIPTDYPCAMALQSFGHGFALKNSDVPTGGPNNVYRLIALGLAGNGYVMTAPDYIRHGFDGEPGIQAFMHAKSEATATIDLMRAARNYCAANNIELSEQVFLTGYSQGGHSSMATAKEIQEFHTNEFQLAGVAPGGGTYDLSGIAADSLLSPTRTTVEPHAFGMITRSYIDIYTGVIPGIDFTFEEIWQAPYDSILLEILDRTHPNTNTSLLDPIPNTMLVDSIRIAAQTDPNHPIRQALADNNLYDWVPTMPLTIYHCGADIENPMENAIFTYNEMVANGSTSVNFENLNPDLGHGECAQWAILAAKNWFATLRTGCPLNLDNQTELANQLSIAPNPVTDLAYLDLSGLGKNLTIKLYDAMGRQLRKYTHLKENTFLFERKDLNAGMYFLEVFGDKRSTVRFVIQ